MNWLLIAIIILTIIAGVAGYITGMVRMIISSLALIISIMAAYIMAPYVSDFLSNNTSADEYIRTRVEDYLSDRLSERVSEVKGDGISKEEIAAQLSVWIDALKRTEQNEIIDGLNLPVQFLEDMKNSYTETDPEEPIPMFEKYVADYMVSMIKSIASYIIAFIIVYVLSQLLICFLDIVSDANVIKRINGVGGAICGILRLLVILWVLFLLLPMFASTKGGMAILEMVEESKVLSFIYNHNLISSLISAVIKFR